MRILMLAQWYPPILGGEELHVANLARALVERGHDVAVATLQQRGLEHLERDGDVRVVRISGALQQVEGLFADSDRRSAAPIPDPALTLALNRVVREFRPDVMHAHNWLVHAALPIRAATGLPLVQTLHDFSLVCATKVLLRKGEACSGPGPIKCLDCTAHHYGRIKGPVTTIANWAGAAAQRRLVDAWIPVSRAVAVGTWVTELRHDVIPNFVPDDPLIAPADDPRLEQLPAEPFFLFVGALGRLKGLPVLLDAYRADPSLPPLVVIGYRMRETDEILRDVPANVHVLGSWPNATVLAAWPRAIAGVAPSIIQEACPTVVIEAMRAGRPVVATALGGTLDLVKAGATGLLVPPADPASLGAALRSLANDPATAATMGEAASRAATAFTASSVVPRIVAVYDRVVAARRRRGRSLAGPARGAVDPRVRRAPR